MDAKHTHDAQIAVLESQTSFLVPVLDSDNKNIGCLRLVINFLATHSGAHLYSLSTAIAFTAALSIVRV
jgi:hypothetical protein